MDNSGGHFEACSSCQCPRCLSMNVKTLLSSMVNNPVFFLPNILCVHVRKLGTSVRKSTTKSDLQNLQNRCRFGQTRCSFVIHRRDIERSHGFCPVASLVHACDRYRSMDFWVLAVLAVFKLNFLKEPRGLQLNALQPLLGPNIKCQKTGTGTSAKTTSVIRKDE